MDLSAQLCEVASNATFRNKGTIEDARRLLDEGADVNYVDENGHTALHYAVFQCKADLIQLFVDRNADVNSVDRNGNTSLHMSAKAGEYNFCAYLLKKGAAHKIFNKEHMAPIHVAAQTGKLESCRKIIEAGGDKNLLSRYSVRWSPLQWAAVGSHEEAFLGLLSIGCDPRIGQPIGSLSRPFEQAFRFPLHYVASKGSVEGVLSMLELGFDISSKNGSRKTPIEMAEKNGHVHVAAVINSWKARRAAEEALKEIVAPVGLTI